MSQFDIQYQPRITIKGQALADFVAESTEPIIVEPVMAEPSDVPKSPMWKLYVDGSSNDCNSGAAIILISPEEHKFHSAVSFGFTS